MRALLDISAAQVVPGVAADHDAGRAIGGEHHRDSPGAVVLIGHGVAVGPGDRDGEQISDGWISQWDAVGKDVAAFAVASDQNATLAAADSVGDRRLKPLSDERDLQVVTHPAVHRDVREHAALDRRHAVDRGRRLADQAATRLDDELGCSRQLILRRSRQGLRVLRDGGGLLGVGVSDAEPSTEVIDVELAQPGQRPDGVRKLLDVENLGADVGVEAVHPQHGAALDPADGLDGLVREQAELRAQVPGGNRRVGRGLDAGDHPDQTTLPPSGRDDHLEPVQVIKVVDHHHADVVFEREF